jgi:small ligand-binding sensory domain FIST
MQFHSATSTAESTSEAVESAVKQLRARLNNVDLAAVFFTGHHVPESADLVERLWLELDPQAIVGCSAEGVIGGDVEIERSPGIAVLAGAMPDVRIHPIHIATDDSARRRIFVSGWGLARKRAPSSAWAIPGRRRSSSSCRRWMRWRRRPR